MNYIVCPKCDGSGQINSQRSTYNVAPDYCSECGGKGKLLMADGHRLAETIEQLERDPFTPNQMRPNCR